MIASLKSKRDKNLAAPYPACGGDGRPTGNIRFRGPGPFCPPVPGGAAAPLFQPMRPFHPVRRSYPILLAAGLLLLAACSSNKREPACPRASILSDAATVTKFRDGPGRDLTDVVSRGEIVDIATQCEYDKRGVTMTLQVAIAGTRGPADRSREAAFDYFVAVADPQRNILAKEVFRVQFKFSENQTRVGTVDEIEPRIPLKDVMKAPDYQVLVGFQLTPDEIEWNRKQHGG